MMEPDTGMPPLTAEFMRNEARAEYENLRDIVTAEPFLDLLEDLYDLPVEDRDEFVRTVILQPAELEKRGITLPEGVVMQRSQFGDDRPTIFCVVKALHGGLRKVTVTFDSQSAALV